MRVFVIGATGYVGSAVAQALVRRGHEVAGAARSAESAEKLRRAGIAVESADISKPLSLQDPARRADALVYAVQYNGENVADVESAALRALVDALAESRKPLVYTSGIWIYGNTGERAADEDAPLNPTPLIGFRPALERIVLDGAVRKVRSIVIRPGDLYGAGGGIPAMLAQSARESGAARFVGDGWNHWCVVHRDDLAELYALAFEKAPAGAIYNAGDDTWFTLKAIAEAASVGAGRNGAVEAWPLEDARKALGAFADALALDSRISSKRARAELGWQTRSTTILDDLGGGSYAAAAR